MKVHDVPPDLDTGALLAGAQFADAFCITVDRTTLDAHRAAEKMLGAVAAMGRAAAFVATSPGRAVWPEDTRAEGERAPISSDSFRW